MIKKIDKNVWRIPSLGMGSECYIIKTFDNKFNKEINILIDTSDISNRENLILSLKEINLKEEDIDVILLTHWHYDHFQNLEIFKKAEVFISKEDKEFFNLPYKDLDKEENRWKNLEIIKTPGHTIGSVCFLFEREDKKILFSGDTLFNGGVGRTDLPSGDMKSLYNSLKKLEELEYDILCPGHMY